MPRQPDIDQAIKNLLKWVEREEWGSRYRAVLEEHLGPARRRLDQDLDRLLDELESLGHLHPVFGFVFEDLATRRFAPQDTNLVDDYLRRHGWRETPRARRYLQALRDSCESLYEATDVVPGRSVEVRDLIEGGDPMRVPEHLASQQLVRWDCLLARVVRLEGEYAFTGGMARMPRQAAEWLVQAVRSARETVAVPVETAVRGDDAAEQIAQRVTDGSPHPVTSPQFTQVWVSAALGQSRRAPPELTNTDGDSLMFGKARLSLAPGSSEAVGETLDNAPGWTRGAGAAPHWDWTDRGPVSERQPRGMAVSTVSAAEARPIYGQLDLKDGALLFQANSRERTEAGVEQLRALLGDLVGTPELAYVSPQEMLATRTREASPQDHESRDDGSAPDLDPAAQAAIISRVKDAHYRSILDKPIPQLANRSPRECMKTSEGRKAVINWLKLLENTELQNARRTGEPPYDTRWLWEALGLEAPGSGS